MSFEHGSPKWRVIRIYKEISLEAAAWTRVAECDSLFDTDYKSSLNLKTQKLWWLIRKKMLHWLHMRMPPSTSSVTFVLNEVFAPCRPRLRFRTGSHSDRHSPAEVGGRDRVHGWRVRRWDATFIKVLSFCNLKKSPNIVKWGKLLSFSRHKPLLPKDCSWSRLGHFFCWLHKTWTP